MASKSAQPSLGLVGQAPPAGSHTTKLRRSSAALDSHISLSIRVESAMSEDSAQLVQDSQSALLEHLPANEIFSLESQELAAPNVTLFVARWNGKPVGCVALVDDTNYGEVKRLYVHKDMRGRGIAAELMVALENYCRDIGLLSVRLETSPALAEAVALYRAMGYRTCGRFGDYPEVDSSLFMERSLGSLC